MEEKGLTLWDADASRVPSNAPTIHHNDVVDQVLARVTAVMVRELIQDKIDELNIALEKMFQKVAVLLHCTNVIDISGSPTIADEHTIVDSANNVIQKCEPIMKYLSFMKEKTDLPSGGDPLLESEVLAAREWANILINALKAMKKVERAAGGLQGIKPSHVVSSEDGEVAIANHWGEWVLTGIEHPVLRTPGTQWHKWFTHSIKATEDRCEVPNHPRANFSILVPRSADFIKRHIRIQFGRFDSAFRVHRKPNPKELRDGDMSSLHGLVMQTCLDPEHYKFVERESFYLDENNLRIRPQTTISGHLPLEELSYHLTQPTMAGHSIWADDNPYLRIRVPIHEFQFLSQPNIDITECGEYQIPRAPPFLPLTLPNFNPEAEEETYNDYADFYEVVGEYREHTDDEDDEEGMEDADNGI
ncbi:hypothetical protein V8F20_000855 [Naviculisporaceae sp. PSN 640]